MPIRRHPQWTLELVRENRSKVVLTEADLDVAARLLSLLVFQNTFMSEVADAADESGIVVPAKAGEIAMKYFDVVDEHHPGGALAAKRDVLALAKMLGFALQDLV